MVDYQILPSIIAEAYLNNKLWNFKVLDGIYEGDICWDSYFFILVDLNFGNTGVTGVIYIQFLTENNQYLFDGVAGIDIDFDGFPEDRKIKL